MTAVGYRQYPPELFATLRDARWSNYRIARALGVSEASVRRGLKRAEYVPTEPSRVKELLVELADLLEMRELRD